MMKKTNYYILLCLFIFSACSEESIQCDEDSVVFSFEVDFSKVLYHNETKNTTHIKVYFEDYDNVGNMSPSEEFAIPEDSKFKKQVCIPVSNHPLDSIYIGLRLIQNNNEINDQPTLFFHVPLKKEESNKVKKTAESMDFWLKPQCNDVPVVFQNLEDFENAEWVEVAIAGGFGVALEGGVNNTASYLSGLAEDCQDLKEYYYSGVCPCSKCYIRFK